MGLPIAYAMTGKKFLAILIVAVVAITGALAVAFPGPRYGMQWSFR